MKIQYCIMFLLLRSRAKQREDRSDGLLDFRNARVARWLALSRNQNERSKRLRERKDSYCRKGLNLRPNYIL